ncbi:MAG: hypothetical protein R6X16_05035 [Anaerolineae bacterium]
MADHESRTAVKRPERTKRPDLTRSALSSSAEPSLAPAAAQLLHMAHAPTPALLKALQRTAGNQAVIRHYVVTGGRARSRAILQRVPRESQAQIESRQPWSEYEITAPLGPVDSTVAEAVRANGALGFSPSKISRLLVSVGLPRRPQILERRFVEALRDFTSRQPAAEQGTEQPEGGEAATAGGETATGQYSSGILDEPTIFALDIGSSWGVAEHGAGARRFYRNQAPWRGMPVEQFSAVRAALLEPLHVTDADMLQESNRVSVTDHFIAQAVNWQMWHRRSEEQTGWGRLGLESFAELGAPVQAPSVTARLAEPETEGAGPGESSATPGVVEPEAGEPEEEPRDEQGLTPTHRSRLITLIEQIDDYTERWYRRVPGESREARAARLAAIDRPMEPILARMRDEIEAMSLPYTDLGRVFQLERIRVRAEALRTEMRVLLGEAERPAAVQTGATVEPSPLARHSLEESMSALSEQSMIVQQEALLREGWDPRVYSGPGSVQQAAQVAIAGLTAMRINMDLLQSAVSGAIQGPAAQLDGALALIHSTVFRPPATLRRPFQPSLPERVNPAEMGDWSQQRKIQYATQWRNRLRDAIAAVDVEIRRHQGYNRERMVVENAVAVQVDLHRTGITITNNNGRPLRAEEMHLDPVFADAMVRFLQELAALGVTELWTAGFLRNAISSADTHPRGQACDMTGFKIGDQLLHLRSGRPQAPPGGAGDENYDSLRRGHSDWYDHAGTVGGMSHERVLHAITNIMRTYFSRIVGPGHNAEHQGHWHVELTQSTARGPQVLAVARDVDQPGFVTQRAEAREQGWRTPGE